ncbi:hypothetical protein P1S61_37020 [Streptomyces sp. ME08-AFT2]|uniref:hypothetical protein n=1 Tax=Streptomyces sp. ME08-AFT2 TaxID=3028683 RepID=UPI0029B4680B|nr:hypothetical protein [Streptomyces sp. ME08-AFT2]MDX3314562.1 hypothetical protein [Streptomyces sp. ME08-AFT2]
MIPLPHRQKAGGPQLGARGPGDVGPFGRYGALEDAELDEDDGGGQDDEDDQDQADT